MAFYEGTYTPKSDMRMRFAGMGDDVLMVHLDGEIVLDANWQPGWSPAKFDDSGPKLPGILKPIRYGTWLDLKGGRSYEIKIIISEFGGLFSTFLFYQRSGSERFKVFSTKPFTSEELSVLRNMNETVRNAL